MQREDWRQRPLPAEMVQYAQNDAHYLLYIAHCLFTELNLKDSGMLDNISIYIPYDPKFSDFPSPIDVHDFVQIFC